MSREILRKYEVVVDFLADYLGENTEVVLHDVQDVEHSIIKIRNGHINDRKVNDPITDFALKTLKNASDDKGYKANYIGLSTDNKRLKCATLFIKDDNSKIIGMLCVNTLVEDIIAATELISSMMLNINTINHHEEQFGQNLDDMTNSIIGTTLAKYDHNVHDLSSHDKQEIIKELNDEGLFLLKGSIPKTAEALNISSPSVYRLIKKVKS